MKTIGIIANKEKDINFEYTRKLIECILSKGGSISIPSETARELAIDGVLGESNENAVFEKSQIIACLGGDGTFLSVSRKAYKYDKPILGINLGSLGFLTEVERHDIDNAVSILLKGEYEIEKRMMLEATVTNNGEQVGTDVALNDVVISRVALSRILSLNTYINNDFVDTFPGDGLIISSPTGSTAYSLSAGGPIVEPDIDLIIVTPICPHILYSRSFVTTGDRVVRVEVGDNYMYNAMVTLDGQKGYRVSGGYTIDIKRSPHSVKLVRIHQRNFFNVLRSKIYDRGENLRKNEI